MDNERKPLDTDFWRRASAEKLRSTACPSLDGPEELGDLARALLMRRHDDDSVVAAAVVVAETAFWFMIATLDVSPFRAGGAIKDLIARLRNMKCGFDLIDFENLLYPQFDERLTITPDKLLARDDVRKTIKARAQELLNDGVAGVRSDVVERWRRLAALEV